MCEKKPPKPTYQDVDPEETQEWLDSLEDILHRWGPERVRFMLSELQRRAGTRGVSLPLPTTTPQVNTVPVQEQAPYPGDEDLEELLEGLIRWNAMAMVVKANKTTDGIGGHLATYASIATMFEVGLNHVFRGRDEQSSGDLVFWQGHASPGLYARAFLEGRLSEQQVRNFRQELADGGGLSSYPHPWLMPEFWQFPTVSMGLGPITAIYQARFNRYLKHRGLLDTSGSRVWAFLGDGEMDEPESRGALQIAAREGLDNLTFIVNCNLQRLDGPVRGNGSIVQELEGFFRGAGWNVVKVLWSREWDELFERDEEGLLARRLGELVDGELQNFSANDAAYKREHLFSSPELMKLVEDWSDEKLQALKRGGLDRSKVYAGYQAALANQGSPTVILGHTVKGWGMGKGGQAQMSTHQQKKLNEESVLHFRDHFGIELSDEEASALALAQPGEDRPEIRYLHERRKALGGYLPARIPEGPPLSAPALEHFDEFLAGSDRPASTTMSFVRILSSLLRHEELGKLIVPVIPDEARTFGMDPFFRQFGIYSPVGQLYEPVDRRTLLYYRESVDGQVLEEGINEAGAMCSLIAAGTAWSTHGVNTIPFYVFYSMFGFQRIADLVWAACDAQCRGFMMGATFGRTTLNGEGLQHQDGHSLLMASAFPMVRAYEPAYAYETAVIVQDGIRRMYGDQTHNGLYYITLHNENYVNPPIPADPATPQAIVDGMYYLQRGAERTDERRVQLFGSGSILPGVLRAAEILRDDYDVAADVWSVTSYKQLREDAMVADRWNRLHPDSEPKSCHLWRSLEGVKGPFVAASDNVALVTEQILPWMPERLWALGTDGVGRSDTRERLRRHFEIDSQSVVVTALHALASQERVDKALVTQAMTDLGVDPDQADSLFA